MIEQLKHAIHYHCGHIINRTEGHKDHKSLWQRATQQQRDEAREGVSRDYVEMGIDSRRSEQLVAEAVSRIEEAPIERSAEHDTSAPPSPRIVSRKRVLVSVISVVAAAVALSIAIAQYRQRVVKEEKAMCARSTILESGPVTGSRELDMTNESEMMEAARVLVAVDDFKQHCIDIMPAGTWDPDRSNPTFTPGWSAAHVKR